MNTISLEDFKKLDIRIAGILSVEDIDGADNLYKIVLSVGGLGERTIVSGIKKYYSKESLVGRQIVYLSNLEAKKIRGIESQGMLLAVVDDEGVSLLFPDRKVPDGSSVS